MVIAATGRADNKHVRFVGLFFVSACRHELFAISTLVAFIFGRTFPQRSCALPNEPVRRTSGFIVSCESTVMLVLVKTNFELGSLQLLPAFSSWQIAW